MLYQRGKAYSQDLRERVFAASDDGERVGEVAELLRVSVAYVSKALTRRRTTGETTVRTQHGHKVPKLAPFYTAIRAYVAERGDISWRHLGRCGSPIKRPGRRILTASASARCRSRPTRSASPPKVHYGAASRRTDCCAICIHPAETALSARSGF